MSCWELPIYIYIVGPCMVKVFAPQSSSSILTVKPRPVAVRLNKLKQLLGSTWMLRVLKTSWRTPPVANRSRHAPNRGICAWRNDDCRWGCWGVAFSDCHVTDDLSWISWRTALKKDSWWPSVDQKLQESWHMPTPSCLRTQAAQEKDGTVDWTHDETLRSSAGLPPMGKSGTSCKALINHGAPS